MNGVAVAQVYKSYDANGNVIFSDKPSKSSEEVEISKPNLSDSFEAPKPSPDDTATETIPAAQTQPEAVPQPAAEDDSADTNNDGRVSRREKEEQRKQQRQAKREMEQAGEGYNE